ncbi:MAG: 3-hydroxyacyl-CoA dehydrogenase family protein [Ignavibacteria bacterium]|nr:3-hydroxyacyl-CoA dehydrogenase family protein [Ignavibacteria bacterium]
MPKQLGIVGSGTLGSALAQRAAISGIDVVLYDINDTLLRRALEQIRSDLQRRVREGSLIQESLGEIFSRIHPRTHLTDLRVCECIVEATIEDLTTKKDLFKHLSQDAKAGTILATTTPSLCVTAIARAATRPERVLGMHFPQTVPPLRLLEIVQTPYTSKDSIEKARGIGDLLSISSVVTQDIPGFIFNRMFQTWCGESLLIAGHSIASVAQIDRLVQDHLGSPSGPFQSMDAIGIDQILIQARVLSEAHPAETRYRAHFMLKRLVDSGKTGLAAQEGFYQYAKKTK